MSFKKKCAFYVSTFLTSFSFVLSTPAFAQEIEDPGVGYEDHACSHEGEPANQASLLKRCQSAKADQVRIVNAGFALQSEFLQKCAKATKDSPWCEEVVRPNPDSYFLFLCTYGLFQPYVLIHPDKALWKNAFHAINLIEQLRMKGIFTCRVNNWWRPEPYNQNVGGAKGRHPKGTSVDVMFCSKNDQELAFKELCKLRKKGSIRAVGYYPSRVLHLGVADKTGNTWGKSCPK